MNLNLVTDFFLACALLGLPMVVFSWFIFSWLFSSGDIDRHQDRKTLSASVKKLKKKLGKSSGSGGKAEYIYGKWMWFGSGFYGLAGLWTFAVIETLQFFGFMLDVGSWNTLMDDGLISFLINFALNQLGNMLQGLLWFTFWPAESILVWVLVAYLAYWAGVELARRSIAVRGVQALDAISLQRVFSTWLARFRASGKNPED